MWASKPSSTGTAITTVSDPFTRYAVFYTPPQGALHAFGEAWLGHSITTANATPRMATSGLPLPISIITARPARYGLHATIQAPFTLADGCTQSDLGETVEDLANRLPACPIGRMHCDAMGPMLALLPVAQPPALLSLAGTIIRDLAPLRAPLSPETYKRYNHKGLTDRQRENLETWGYAHVMEDYRFHITLTDRLSKTHQATVLKLLKSQLSPILRAPLTLDALSLVGEREDGRFQLIARFPLQSPAAP